MSDFEKTHPINLMIAGAQKSGTTSLLRYLGDHPGICTHSQLEMSYFVNDAEYKQGYDRIFPRYFSCSLLESPLLLAKSVSVLLVPIAISRLLKHNPYVQVVVILRNPVDRAYSHYWYSRRRGWEERKTFEDAIDLDPNLLAEIGNINTNYIANGLYVIQLERIMALFPPEQIHVVLLNDLKKDPVTVCHSIYSLFPQLDQDHRPDIDDLHNISAAYRSRSLALLTSSRSTFPRVKRVARTLIPDRMMDYLRDFIRNANEHKFSPPPMRQETRSRLLAYFKPYNRQLGKLIKRDLDHWNK